MGNITSVFSNNNTKTLQMTINASVVPAVNDTSSLGTSISKYADLYASQTTIGAFFETGLLTEDIGKNPTGTIVSWRNGKLIPSDFEGDHLVMGVIKNGKDEPIIFGAEPILVTGVVNEGDYIITSKKIGHGIGIERKWLFKRDVFGKVIAQALESASGESSLIKCMIRKM